MAPADPAVPVPREAISLAACAHEALAISRPRCVRVLARFRVPPEDAEDLLHDAVVLLLRKGDEVRCPERWLPRALTNLCLHYWRDRLRRPEDPLEGAGEAVAAGECPETRAIARHDLDLALADLAPRPLRLLLLRYVEGFTAAETAARLGYSEASVDRIARRGLDLLATRLASAAPTSAPD